MSKLLTTCTINRFTAVINILVCKLVCSRDFHPSLEAILTPMVGRLLLVLPVLPSKRLFLNLTLNNGLAYYTSLNET
jgi:hypothetical protein